MHGVLAVWRLLCPPQPLYTGLFRRQPELVPVTLTALSKIALAEAQTVAAARAAAKGSLPMLVASLHVGIAGALTMQQ